MWASVASIKSNAASLKKCYTFLVEQGIDCYATPPHKTLGDISPIEFLSEIGRAESSRYART